METIIQQGDIIIFDNKHKIYCGDCKDINSYDFLKDDDIALCLTSPPYNVGKNNYGSTSKCGGVKYQNKADDIKGDEEYLELLNKSLNNSLKKAKYTFYNIAHLSGNKISLLDFLHENKEKYVDTMVWIKDTTLPAIEYNILNSDYEYIYIFTNIQNNGRHIRIGQDFRGEISNVIRCRRNSQNEFSDIHKALFPLELCNTIINNFTNENDIVLDVFSGLGTTMISCMLNNRIYRGIEIEPLYCQETINRYLKYKYDDYDIKIIRNNQVIDFKDIKNEIIHEYNLFTI